MRGLVEAVASLALGLVVVAIAAWLAFCVMSVVEIVAGIIFAPGPFDGF